MSGIVLAVTFLAIYRQLRLQRDAAAIERGDRDRRYAPERDGPARADPDPDDDRRPTPAGE